ncbi:MAG: Na+:solute symporter, partial [Gemmatimonadota bacterium]
TGLIYLLRWFWWRINAWSEISGMALSFAVAVYFQFGHVRLGFAPLDPTETLVLGVAITTAGWLLVTFLTRPTDQATLQTFYDKIRPAGRGWRKAVITDPSEPQGQLSAALLAWFLGCVVVYGAMFATGSLLYGHLLSGSSAAIVSAGAAVALVRILPRVGVIR